MRGGGGLIPADSDLNSNAFSQPGLYKAATRPIAQSLTNCPATKVFLMHVEEITIENTDTWVYIRREIIEAGESCDSYHQYVQINKKTDTTTFGSWYKVSKELIT